MESMISFFGSGRYQTIAVWRYLNRKFRNDWTFRRPHVWQDLSAQNCWQMPRVFVYTDKLSDEQWPGYTRCLSKKFGGISQSDIWTCCMTLDEANQNLADLSWIVNGENKQQPVLITLPKASHACKKFYHCSWIGLCDEDSCTWKKYNLPCTDLSCCQGRYVKARLI